MSDKPLHCWKDQGEHIEETEGWDAYLMFAYGGEGDTNAGGTCMLPDGHAGPHVFTPDDQIVVRFATARPGGAGE